MPSYDIDIPGKGTFRVDSPTDLTDQQAYNAVLGQLGSMEPKERTWGEAASDIGASLQAGVGTLAQLPGQIGQLAGLYTPEEAETGLQGIGRQLERSGQAAKSEALKAKEAAREQKVGQAQGVVDEFWTAIKETATDPALMTSFFAEQVPNLIGSMGAGMLTRGAVKGALALSTEQTIAKAAASGLVDKAGISGMVGAGAIMQGADVGADTFENLYGKLVKDGTPPEKAAEIALDKARMASIEAAGISVATAFLPGGTTLERALVGRGLPRTGGIAKGLVGEAAQEGIEEGGGQLAANVQEQSLYPETDIMKGVGQAAGMGALMGGAFGGIGGVSLRGQPAVAEPVAEPTVAEPAPVAAPTEAPAAAAPEAPTAPSESDIITGMEKEAEVARGFPQPVEPTVETTAEPVPPESVQPTEAAPVVEPTTEPVTEPAAEPVRPPELPETMHPAEATGFEGAGVIKQQAIDAAAQKGIQYAFDDAGKIMPRQSKLDWNVLGQAKTGKDLLDTIYDHVPVDYQRLIDRIAPSVGKTGIQVANTRDKWNGIYDPRSNVARFRATSDVGNSFDVMLHELTHAATVNNYYDAIDRKQASEFYKPAKEMDKLADYLSKNYSSDLNNLWFLKSRKYPTQSRGMELIARALTNRDVQEELKKIKYAKRETGWTKFVAAMRNLLGMDPKDDSALSHVLDLSEQFIKPQKVKRPIREAAPIAEEEQDVEERFPSPRATVTQKGLTAPPWNMESPDNLSATAKFVDDHVYKYIDKFVDLKKIIKAINETDKKLDASWDAYMRETLYHNRVDFQTKEFLEKELKPLAQDMVARGVSQEELNNFLMARHADEYNQSINERNDRPDLQDRGSGVHSLVALAYMNNASKQEVAEIRRALTESQPAIVLNANEEALLKDLESMTPAKRKSLNELAKKVDDIVKETQDTAVRGGIEKDTTIDYWRDKYPNYVPLKRTPEELDFVETSTGMGQGFSAKAGFGKAATGSLKGVDNILSNIILQRDMAIVKSEKARIGRAVYAMALSHPNPSFWLPVNPNASVISKANDLYFKIEKMKDRLSNMDKTIAAKQARGEGVTEEDLGRRQDLAEQIAKEQVRHDDLRAQGETIKQEIIKELVAMGLDPKEVDNLIREPQGAWYNPTTKKVEYVTNSYLRSSPNVLAVPVNGETRYIFFNPGNDTAKRLVKSLRGADVEQIGQMTAMIAKFTRWIAKVNTQYNPFFGIVNMIRDVQGAQFNLSTTPLRGQQMAVNKNIFPAAATIYRSLRSGEPKGQFAEEWNDFQKRGGPTGMWDMLVDQKKNESALEKEILELQRNPSQKVMRRGLKAAVNWMSDFNDTMENGVRLAAFIEAKKKFTAQGMNPEAAADKATELAKNLTVNFNRKGAKTNFVNSLYAFFNASVQGTARLVETLKGPSGKKIMGSLALLGVIQQLALSAAGFDEDDPPEFVRQKNLVIPTGGGNYLSWPMPLGFNIFVNTGRIATAVAQGHSPSKNLFNMMGATVDSFSPLGGGSVFQAATPTALDPIAALYGNVDAFGRPIARMDMPSKPVPGYLRSTEGATEISKLFAQVLNRASGGTDFQKGELSPTADQIDYLAGQLGGGTYREARKVAEFAKSQATGEPVAPYRVPLAGRFMGDTKSEANVRNKFYENVNTLAGYEEEIKGRIKNNQNPEEFLNKHPEAAMYKTADQVYSKISDINSLRKKMIEQGATKEQLKQLNEVKIQLMKQFNEAYASVTPK